MERIRIDEEFRTLIPPLTDDEKSRLEKSLREEGCRDALVVWGDTLIDGHNRYEICTRYDIPFKTISMEFNNRDDVMLWMMKNQLSRRNLTTFQRLEIVEKLKPVIQAKSQQGSRSDLNFLQNSVKSLNTQKELAKLANTSHDTVAKFEKVVKEAPFSVVEATRKGELSIDSAYQVTKMEPEKQAEIIERIESGEKPKAVVLDVKKKPFVVNNTGNNEWYTPSKFIELARKVMGSIDTDPASSEKANETVRATTFYTVEDDGLTKAWTGNVWMNPPYSSELIAKFIEKIISERSNYKQAIVLVNNATDTAWFQDLASIGTAACFPRGRIKFNTPEKEVKGTPLQGQAIIYIGTMPEVFLHEFRTVGWVVRIV
ncbi:MAG: hypothetical protein IIY21_03500 [Clostridiales bacterium]|nr:hypothetical protein [Clostridiales bacterium]